MPGGRRVVGASSAGGRLRGAGIPRAARAARQGGRAAAAAARAAQRAAQLGALPAGVQPL